MEEPNLHFYALHYMSIYCTAIDICTCDKKANAVLGFCFFLVYLQLFCENSRVCEINIHEYVYIECIQASVLIATLKALCVRS